MSRTLTLGTLIRLKACDAQVAKFHARFGESVDVTEALCVSVADEFDWNWAASHLLSPSAEADYNRAIAPAWADYNRAIAPARADYDRAVAPARADYRRAIAPARADYDRAIAPAQADYDRAVAPARADYDRAIAAIFGRLYAEGVK